MKIKYLLPLLLLILFVSTSSAQFGYKNVYDTVNNVEISYKWSHSKWWKNDSPLQLRFKFKNRNDYKVKVEFELVYLHQHKVKFRSGMQEATIKGGRAISGKLNGFYFETPDIPNEKLRSEKFEWDLSDLNIKKVEN